MKPDLRDWFAAHVAAALAAEQRLGLETIAARAYDVADALLLERGQRLEAELAAARDDSLEGHASEPSHLLDFAVPVDEDDVEVDPAWLDAQRAPASDRPGLARTTHQLELPMSGGARKVGA